MGLAANSSCRCFPKVYCGFFTKAVISKSQGRMCWHCIFLCLLKGQSNKSFFRLFLFHDWGYIYAYYSTRAHFELGFEFYVIFGRLLFSVLFIVESQRIIHSGESVILFILLMWSRLIRNGVLNCKWAVL